MNRIRQARRTHAWCYLAQRTDTQIGAARCSISGTTLHPGINVAARTPDLGAGILGAEETIFAGIASQGTSDGPRLGDYSQFSGRVHVLVHRTARVG